MCCAVTVRGGVSGSRAQARPLGAVGIMLVLVSEGSLHHGWTLYISAAEPAAAAA